MSELAQEITRELLTRLEPLSLRRLELEEQIARSQEEITRIDQILAIAGANGTKPKSTATIKTRRQRRPQVRTVFGTNVEQNAELRLRIVRNYFREHGSELVDGFTGAELSRRVSTPEAPITPERMRKILEHLLDEGEIYADRKVRGGGTLYKLVNAPKPEPEPERQLDADLLQHALA